MAPSCLLGNGSTPSLKCGRGQVPGRSIFSGHSGRAAASSPVIGSRWPAARIAQRPGWGGGVTFRAPLSRLTEDPADKPLAHEPADARDDGGRRPGSCGEGGMKFRGCLSPIPSNDRWDIRHSLWNRTEPPRGPPTGCTRRTRCSLRRVEGVTSDADPEVLAVEPSCGHGAAALT